MLKLKRDLGSATSSPPSSTGPGAGPRPGRRQEDTCAAVAKLVKGAIYDLSTDARMAAKLACYAAMTAVIPLKTVEVNLEATVERAETRAAAVVMNGGSGGGG